MDSNGDDLPPAGKKSGYTVSDIIFSSNFLVPSQVSVTSIWGGKLIA